MASIQQMLANIIIMGRFYSVDEWQCIHWLQATAQLI